MFIRRWQINAKTLPRIQTLGMTGVVLLLTLSMGLYFSFEMRAQIQERLSHLRDEIIDQQKKMLTDEMSSIQGYLKFIRLQAEQVLKNAAKAEVEQAIAIARALYQKQKGQMPDPQLAELIINTLRDIRFFEGRGYIFIDDMQGQCILLPTAPHLEGTSFIENQDDTGHYIMRGLIDAVKNPQGAGFSRYRWYAPRDPENMADKISYVQYFAPFDWIIGAGDYLYRVEDDLKKSAIERLNSIRFGNFGYISVLSGDGYLISNPTRTAQVGKHYSTFESYAHAQLFQQLMNLGKNGGGFLEYDWYLPDGSGPYPKLSLVAYVQEWDWILVAGIYLSELNQLVELQEAEINQAQQKDFITLLIALGVATIISLLAALWFASWLRQLFARYQADLDQQNKTLIANARELELAAQVFANASEGIMVTDEQNRIVTVNQAFTYITGYSLQDVKGRNPSMLSSGRHPIEFYTHLWRTLQRKGQWQGELWNRRKDGSLYPEWLSIVISRDKEGKIAHYVATFNDISERKDVEERLRYMAEYDSLTDLPNRRLLHARATQAMQREHTPDTLIALLFIDLDRFKNINDSLGHAIGDEVLKKVAKRLVAHVPVGDTVSRIGGDEFVILTTGISNTNDIALLAEMLIKAVARPIHCGEHELVITPSIGIALYPEDGEDFDTLSRNADAALYHAKESGKNTFQFFTAELNQRVSERLSLENALRIALNQGEFELYYQPQYRLATQKLVGCEALIRWNSPEHGLVSPLRFIPLAEETGLILPIGEWVLAQACRQGEQWRQAGAHDFSMAVNLSALQFRHDLIGCVERVLQETGFPAGNLVLEVTESVLMEHAEHAAQTLGYLKRLGVQVALDDFGTGYSSLAYLKRFPLDKLKIDKTFVAGLPEDKDDAAITSSVIDIAKNLRLHTVAEGIETQAHLDFLTQAGCEDVQGYLLSRPLPAAAFVQHMQHPPAWPVQVEKT
ncbi:PAS domain S-box-containing protein/diguanylate cyclase (GGDEF) domain-containing protein [Allopseudospirillum japonicum]|uniref:cyclic-guanylate-specific phosphodiesterase n=1 Tax=Allopseudospirillum japonicum TaxID=64971 RepID=A0A1H6TZ17_9GAMM|nr:cache domain-containing protein [Allopseudospirillum japonicum]SEI85368.1 PAS domain S-box-containing protein/diguanylate cyclase (GGDEF) domain-containing protein [Allopseudospirillum japonicum]